MICVGLLVLMGKLRPKGRKGPAQSLIIELGCSSTPGPYSILFPVIPHCVLDWNGLGDVGYSKQQHLEEEKTQLAESLKSNLSPKGNQLVP